MFMRKLLVVLGPLMMCLLTCLLFRWLDGMLAAGNFFLYAIKGVTLGVCVSLLLTVAGISTRNTGLTGWLYVAAGLLFLTLLYQYLEAVHVVNWPALEAIISINGQVVLVESTVMGFLLLTAALSHKRRR